MVLGVGYLEGSCTHYAKHSIAVYARSSIVKGVCMNWWSIWAKSLGEKVGSDRESDAVAIIRTFWWGLHVFTCFMIIIHNGRNLGWW